MKNSIFFESWKKSIVDYVKRTHIENKKVLKMPDNEVVTRYITYIRECVYYPVTVIESKEVKSEIKNYPELVSGYNEIKDRLQKGEGVQPYLSTKAYELRPDDLYNDWQILHLHLGVVQGNKKKSKRSNLTLRMYVENLKAYFICLEPHKSYANSELLKIMYENWPEIIERHELKGITLDKELSEDDIIKYRNKGIMSLPSFVDNEGKSHVIAMDIYTVSKISERDSELLDKTIPEFINNIVDSVKKKIIEKDIIKSGVFHYEKGYFVFGIEDKNRKIDKFIFMFKDTEFWESLFNIEKKGNFKIFYSKSVKKSEDEIWKSWRKNLE